ncbi:MAG: hypothetical protein R6V08_05380 [Desulfuromonadales bacterium]
MPQEGFSVDPFESFHRWVDVEKNKILAVLFCLQNGNPAVNMVEQCDKAVFRGDKFLPGLQEQSLVAGSMKHLTNNGRQQVEKDVILGEIISRTKFHHLDSNFFVPLPGYDDKGNI